MLARTRFIAACAALFVASTTVTIAWCRSMPAVGGMHMPAGCTMSVASMPSMPMSRPTWAGEAGAFLGMWSVMMLAMMLPVLVPMLERYRESVSGASEARLARLTALVGAGYFAVWTGFGILVIPVRAALQSLAGRQPVLAGAVPVAAAVVVVLAGVFQFTRWKSRQLDCCRRATKDSRVEAADAGSALRHGMRLGLRCCACCANLMVILLVVGVMDLRAMAVVTAGMTSERLAPPSWRTAGVVGVVAIGGGLLLLARAGGIG